MIQPDVEGISQQATQAPAPRQELPNARQKPPTGARFEESQRMLAALEFLCPLLEFGRQSA
jgi:hypothetical protein